MMTQTDPNTTAGEQRPGEHEEWQVTVEVVRTERPGEPPLTQR